MIPIRNFPYTDYHDLNLDFILRQFQQYEIDIDELKRRVKALEDWRIDVVEPDLVTIKADIRDIKGDIISLGDRITTNTSYINTLANNVKTYYISVDHDQNITVREGNPDTGTIIDIKNDDNAKRSFINRFVSVLSDKGEINDKVYMHTPEDLSYQYTECIIDVNTLSKNVNIYGRKVLDNAINEVNLSVPYSTSVVAHWSYFGIRSSKKSFWLDTDYWQSSGDATYPYKYEVNAVGMSINDNSQIDVYFTSLSDFETYSSILSEYVENNGNKAVIYAKSIPANNIQVNIIVTGGN